MVGMIKIVLEEEGEVFLAAEEVAFGGGLHGGGCGGRGSGGPG